MSERGARVKGDVCECCKKLRLILVNGALVCADCDSVDHWPNVKREDADIDR